MQLVIMFFAGSYIPCLGTVTWWWATGKN